MTARIALLGEYSPDFEPHIVTEIAIEHSAAQLGIAVEATWVSTADIDQNVLNNVDGLWVAPGSPYRSMQRTLQSIRHVRENHIPCFGTCGGFQHMILEYARNVLEIEDAQHAEYDPYASCLFISRLECSLAGQKMSVRLAAGSRVAAIYAASECTERYYCNFGINAEYVPRLGQGPLQVTGVDETSEIRVVELPEHPFFLATLFVPQTSSTPDAPHPLVTEFVRSAAAVNASR